MDYQFLIFFDLDGTLIGSTGDVDSELWGLLEALRRAGGHLSVCTGRPYMGVAQQVADRLDPQGLHIFHNGALVTKNGQVVVDNPLSSEAASELARRAQRLNATLEFYTSQSVFVDRMTPECQRHAEVLGISVKVRDLEEVAYHESVLRGHWILEPERVDEVMRAEVPQAVMGHATSTAIPGLSFISVTRKDVTKGQAVRHVIEAVGGPAIPTWGFGDSTGDLPMLEAVDSPWVMADAPRELLDRFPVVPSVEQGGLRQALEALSNEYSA